MLERGYAEIVPQDELEAVNGTYHNMDSITFVKSEVFDFAATFDETSLNKELQGPDLTNTLTTVMCTTH